MNRMKLGEILSVKHGWAFKGEYFAEDGEQSILTPGNFFEKGGFKGKLYDKCFRLDKYYLCGGCLNSHGYYCSPANKTKQPYGEV